LSIVILKNIFLLQIQKKLILLFNFEQQKIESKI
jgi:hypothetical protein